MSIANVYKSKNKCNMSTESMPAHFVTSLMDIKLSEIISESMLVKELMVFPQNLRTTLTR